MIKVALIGVGKMGLSHYAILSAHPVVEVVAVCDSSAFMTTALKKQMDVRIYKNFKKMFKECELDAVVISTPNSTHFDIAHLALSQDLNVFLEKPLCLDPEQSAQLSDLARERKLVNQVGYHNRFLGTFQEMRRLVGSGAIGEVHHLEGTAYGQVVIRKKASKTWRSSKSEGGGCLHDYACHVLDLMNFIYQAPSAVKHAQLQSIFSKDLEDAVYATFEYGSGATGYLETNWSDQSYRKMSTTITAYGTGGKIITDRQELKVYLAPGRSFESFDEGWTIKYITELQKPVNYYLRGEEYSAQIDQFANSILGKSAEVESTFATAAETDGILETISRFGAN